ncbi:aldehyde dehydrogenase domain-containing protein [Lipomyces oligophaga]|uniref:aldehyde dehydrogenase domain-containing protein n=1 Tax=Lipomyces oligophaga TaxID=45792 RepID=UPI0034CDA7A2
MTVTTSAPALEALKTLKRPDLFIGDGFVAGEWVSSSKTFPVYEPSTGQVLGPVADLTRADFVKAIESADKGYRKYSTTTTAHERSALLRKWYDLIIANKEDIGTILVLENGKTYAEAVGEVAYAASFVSWFAEEASRAYGDVIPSSMPNTTVLTLKQPVGVCGIITPWNFPAAMITRKIAPALAVGCSVVIKPPSETPYTAAALVKLAMEAGLPADVIHLVPTKDRDAATELCTSPIVKKISFTGSTNVGIHLSKLAMGTMKKISMELGGNAPFIVFDDADIDLAVQGAMVCKFRCSGQTCVCANRLFVHKKVAAEFTAKLVAEVEKLKVGYGLSKTTTQGPLVNKGGVEKVKAHIKDAVSKGAKLETGGSVPSDVNPNGFFIAPSILSGVTTEMVVARDETFGPLAPIFQFETEEEAVELANSTEFGLAGYFFSRDINRCLRVAASLECGLVGVNSGKISAAESPFGGVKQSGVGREGSMYGLAEYQIIKAVTIGNTNV